MEVKGGFSVSGSSLDPERFAGAPVLAAILFIMVVFTPTFLHADTEGMPGPDDGDGGKNKVGLVLGAPSSDPSGIPLGKGFKTIRFHSLVWGTAKAPKSLSLDEADVKGKVIEKGKNVATLLDDGKGEDKHAGDYVYTGAYKIKIDVEDERYFRVSAVYMDKTVISGVSTLGITSFPLDARPSNPKMLDKDPDGGGLRLFANEVLLVLNPGLSSYPGRIKKIAASVGGEVKGVIPSIRVYLVEIPDNTTAKGVKEAIKTLQKGFGKELRRAIPNHEVVSQGSHTPQDPAAICSNTINNANAGTESCQWYIQYNTTATEVVDPVGITKAWDIAGGGSSTHKVATIDPSGIMGTHTDLSNQCIHGGASPGVDACDQTNAAYNHGTWVAGVLAAKSDDTDIAGVAWDTKLVSYQSDSTYTISNAINDIRTAGTVKIVNLSFNAGGLETAIADAASNGILFIASAGTIDKVDNNTCSDDVFEPASLSTVPDNIIAVGATDIDNSLADYTKSVYNPFTFLYEDVSECSNRAGFVDVYAPGEDIYTTTMSGTPPYTHASGTSLAVPIVSGAAAILWNTYPAWAATGIHDRIVERAKTLCKSGATTPCTETDPDKIVTTTDSRLHNKRLLDIVAALGPPTLTPNSQNITLTNNCGVYDSKDVVAVVRANDIDNTLPRIPDTYVESLSYSFVSATGASVQTSGPFSIDSSTGVITVADTLACPFTGTTLPIRVTDFVDLSDTGELAINVIDQESLCWPPHRGVPGAGTWNVPPTIDGDVQDDVGWTGAHRLTYGNGGTENLAFQGLKQKDNKYLYMSFEVRNDDSFDVNDQIVLYFRRSTGTADDGRRILISPNCNVTPCAPTTTLSRYDYTNGAWTGAGTPSNLDVVAKSNPDGSSNQWNIEVKVPTAGGVGADGGGAGWVDLGQDFLFYFNVIRIKSTGPEDTAVEFRWPRNSTEITGTMEDYVFGPRDLGLATTSNTATCNGLWLAWNDIGTLNDPRSKINTISGNKFFATVHNDTEVGGVNQAIPNVSVRFRIADWGLPSQWNDIRADTPPSGCVYDANDSNYNPTCLQDLQAGSITEFNLDWTLTAGERSDYITKDHQCILVEIDSLSNANIITKSVYRNMDFVDGSEFKREATISAKSYGPPPDGKTEHIFDLHVTTRELPVEMDEKRAAREREDEVESRFMWELNGYRHTGRFIVINNKKYAITDPVGSFGYIVSHKGSAVQDWQQVLLGAEKVGKNLYRLSIKPGEVAKVTTKIVPEEQDKWWWLWILIIILILLVIMFVIHAVKSNQKGGQ